MRKWLVWPSLLGTLWVLSQLHAHTSHPVVNRTGTELRNAVDADRHAKVAVQGTVERVRSQLTGLHTIELQADDGAAIAILVPPQLDLPLPRAGERIAVTGTQQDLGVLRLEFGEDLQPAGPRYTTADRPACGATLVPKQRCYLTATVHVRGMSPKGTLYVTLLNPSQRISGVVYPELTHRVTEGVRCRMWGYLDQPYHTFVVEDIEAPGLAVD